MESQTRLKLGIATLGVLLVLSGCAQVTVHSEVSADGTISEYQMDLNMSRQAYGYFQQSVRQDGYNSTREYFQTRMTGPATEGVDINQEYQGDTVSTTVTIDRIDPEESPVFNVTVENGQVEYRDRSFVNRSATPSSSGMMGGMTVDYYLTMPGEITSSNADVVDGNTAEWHRSGQAAFVDTPIRATSEVPIWSRIPWGILGGALVLLSALVVGGVLYRRR